MRLPLATRIRGRQPPPPTTTVRCGLRAAVEQELLPEAGAWGYVAGFLLLALMVLPAVIGMVLGVRARRLGEHRLGTIGIVVNALIATYLAFMLAASLLFG